MSMPAPFQGLDCTPPKSDCQSWTASPGGDRFLQVDEQQRRQTVMISMQKLPRSFYDRDPVTVARELLGKYLMHVRGEVERIGRIVEVEAYLGPHDLAAHSSKGFTKRTKIMFGPPGRAYIYLIYGMYYCMNVVTEREGHGSAVLLRALEPIAGIEGRTGGPGLLCRAMGIDGSLNGHDLQSNDFHIAAGSVTEDFRIVERPRVGVEYSGVWADKPLRFYVEGSTYVSKR